MIENRAIGKGANRGGFQAGAMGEASATCSRSRAQRVRPRAHRRREPLGATGTYVTGNKLRGIRDYAANFPYTGAFPSRASTRRSTR